MNVNLEEVKNYLEWKKKINEVPLREINWFKDGGKVEIKEDILEQYEYTGLSNLSLAEFYLL